MGDLARPRWRDAAAGQARQCPVGNGGNAGGVSRRAIGAAVVLLVRKPACGASFAFLTVVAALVLAVFMTVNSVKMFSYAMWFGMPVIALAALRLCAYTALAAPLLVLSLRFCWPRRRSRPVWSRRSTRRRRPPLLRIRPSATPVSKRRAMRPWRTCRPGWWQRRNRLWAIPACTDPAFRHWRAVSPGVRWDFDDLSAVYGDA